MYISTILLIIIYTTLIIYVYFRYNHDVKPTETYELYKDELEISASEAAYLENKSCNNINLILADILTLVNKKYIDLQMKENGTKREYIFVKTKKDDFTEVKNHEMMSYNLFFENGAEVVNLNDFLNKIGEDKETLEKLEIKMVSMKRILDMELQNHGLIDKYSEKQLFKFHKIGLNFLIINILIIFITLVAALLYKINGQLLEFSYFGLLFSILLYKTTELKEEKLTEYGANTLEKVKALKSYLKNYVISEDKPIYMVNILEYYYIMAVAFGFAKLGEREFIENTYKKSKKKSTYITIIVLIASIVIVLLSK